MVRKVSKITFLIMVTYLLLSINIYAGNPKVINERIEISDNAYTEGILFFGAKKDSVNVRSDGFSFEEDGYDPSSKEVHLSFNDYIAYYFFIRGSELYDEVWINIYRPVLDDQGKETGEFQLYRDGRYKNCGTYWEWKTGGCTQTGNISDEYFYVCLTMKDSFWGIEYWSAGKYPGTWKTEAVRKQCNEDGTVYKETFLNSSIFTIVDDYPPEVKIYYPESNKIYHNTVPVEIKGKDNCMVTNLQIYIDGSPKININDDYYNNIFSISDLLEGIHTVSADATDQANNKGQRYVYFRKYIYTLNYCSGDNQIGLTSSKIPEPLIAQIVDAEGNPHSNVPIVFAIDSTPGGAKGTSFSNESEIKEITVKTNNEGKAQVYLYFGSSEGTYTVTASCSEASSGSPFEFTETAKDPDVKIVFMGYNDNVKISDGLPVYNANFDKDGNLIVAQNDTVGVGIDKDKNVVISPHFTMDAYPKRPPFEDWYPSCKYGWAIKGVAGRKKHVKANTQIDWNGNFTITKRVGRPDSKKFGPHNLQIKFNFKHDKAGVGKQEINVPIKIFFAKGPITYPEDYDKDGDPNWYEFWVEALGESQRRVYYTKSIDWGDYQIPGRWTNPPDYIRIGKLAGYGPPPRRDDKIGIDCFYCVMTHEFQHYKNAHYTVDKYGTCKPRVVEPLGIGLSEDIDTDGDGLPNEIDPYPNYVNGAGYEYTDKEAWRGDWEYSAFLVENVIAPAEIDWANPGKQTK